MILTPNTQGAANTVGATVTADVLSAARVVLHVKNTGTVTLAAGSFVFESSLDSTNGTDGTWFGLQAVRTNANTIETTAALAGITAAAGNAYGWTLSVVGSVWFRVRCTVAVTASASATWTIQEDTSAAEPIPAAQVSAAQPVTLAAGVIAASTPATPTAYSAVTTASTNLAVVKASAAVLFEVTVSNPTASACWVKLYNKSSAPVVATDVPIVTIPVPAGELRAYELGALGKRFLLGIAIGATGAAIATDATNAPAGVQIHASYL